MEDRTSIWIGALAGAIIGGAAGYLLLTERGRRLRADLEPRLFDLIAELARARDAAVVARDTIAHARTNAGSGHDASVSAASAPAAPGWR